MKTISKIVLATLVLSIFSACEQNEDGNEEHANLESQLEEEMSQIEKASHNEEKKENAKAEESTPPSVEVPKVGETNAKATVKPTAKTDVKVENNPKDHSWSYNGQRGPASWGNLCSSGKQQSPINLTWKAPKQGKKIEFHYGPTKPIFVDNGHTLQLDFPEGNYITVGNEKYSLVQLHWHAESEHLLSGKRNPLEMHLVHKNSKGNLSVVGIFFKIGQSNPLLEQLWKSWPQEKDRKVELKANIDLTAFEPAKPTFYHYVGSLTTPPCTEKVAWNVFNTPMEMSAAQYEMFKKRYHGNYRPVQDLNGRKVANY